LVKLALNPDDLQMETEFCGIKFPNKVGIAAGFDKNAEVFDMMADFGFGHVEIGTVTPKGQSGNPKPRLFRLKDDHALINRMGFNNKGLEEAVKRLKKRKNKVIVGGNIGKNTNTPNELAINDYLACFEGLYPYVDYITVNVSCPNITNLKKLQDQEELEKILQAIDLKRASTSIYKPVLLKISPDLNWDQIDETLAVIQRCHIDGIVAVNTTTIRKGLKTPENKVISIGNGGLSGLPLKDRSTEIIRYIHQKTKGKLPIIGVGGIENAEDAITKLEAGATLLQVYTGFIYKGPILAKSINYMCKFYI
jgi:dihydroorotate dehydrogenase